MKVVMEKEGLVTGIIYQNEHAPSYQEQVPGYAEAPLVDQNLKMTENEFYLLMQDFM
jgi:2-oxoglutarate ferredoxin oxidoreductase subunit beta